MIRSSHAIVVLALSFLLSNLRGCLPTGSQPPLSTEQEAILVVSPPPVIVTQTVADETLATQQLEGIYPPGTQLDSLKVIYSSNGELWLWEKGAKRSVATQGTVYSPRISPDGSLVAFLRPVGAHSIELWAIKLDGTDKRRVVSVGDLEAIGGANRDPNAVAIVPHRFEWLPASHTLAFNTEYVYQGPGTVLLNDFNLVDVETGSVRYQLLPGWGGEFFLSPSGEHLAISTSTNVILSNLDGSDWRSVFAYDAVITYSDYHFYAAPTWSPDGSYLLLALPPTDPLADSIEPIRLIRIDVADSVTREIGSVTSVPFFDTPVAFSPDLKKIAFLAPAEEPVKGKSSLFTANADGTGANLVREGEMLRFLGWDLAGEQVAFTLGENQHLFIGFPDRGVQQVQPGIFGVIQLRWLDAQRFIYLQGAGEQSSLYLFDENSGNILIDTAEKSRLQFDFLWLK